MALLVAALLLSLGSPSAHGQTWISAVSAAATTAGATISWTSAVPADSQVEYGPTLSYGSMSPLISTKLTSHSVTLSGLTAGSTYHFRVRSSDVSGSLVLGPDYVLTTSTPVSVSVSPMSASLAAKATQQFTATVANTSNKVVTWSASGGSITVGGLFTAPMVSSTTAVTVTATSQADPSKYAAAALQITPTTAGGTALIGDQTVEGTVNRLPAGIAEVYGMPATSSGSVAKLSVYVDSITTSTGISVGLYSDSGGHPGALLTSGRSSTLLKGTWNTVPVPAINLAAGNRYWFAVLPNDGTLGFRQKYGTGGWTDELHAVQTLTALPSTWTTGTVYSGGAWTSAYASGSVDAVSSASPPPAPILAINPASLSFAGQAGTSSLTPGGVVVTNVGSGPLSFTAASDQPWLGLSPASGTAPSTIQVTPSASALKAGSYTGHVTVTGGGTSKIATISLTVTSPPVQHSVALAWAPSQSPSVVGYNLYRSTVSGTSYGMLSSAVSGTSYSDQNVQSGVVYYYVVTAIDSLGRARIRARSQPGFHDPLFLIWGLTCQGAGTSFFSSPLPGINSLLTFRREIMKTCVALLLIVLAATLCIAQDRPAVPAQSNTVLVGADGKFEASPDTALMQFNISAQEATSREAYDRASKAAEQVRQILRTNGIDPRSAEIGYLSLQPVYDHKTAKRKLVGYQVNANVSLKLKDFSKIAPIVQQLADADITSNQSLNYTLENMDAAKAKAVEDAYRRAHESAAVLARSAGRALGDLSYASVDTFENVRPMPGVMMRASVAGAAPPPTEEFTPQSVSVTAHVNTLFNLK